MLLNSNEAILKDIKIWKEFKKLTYNNIYVLLSNLLIENKDFRNLFYYRVKRFLKYENHKKIVKILVFVLFVPAIMLLREMPTLIIGGEIGGGLLLVHCFCTVISPEKMGEACVIWHDVTIGFDDKMKAPIIGNNIRISAGAKIIGGIKVGDNSVIGPNTLVVRNIPANSVVVANPSYIVKKEGKNVIETLNNY